jgi:hypothetical protein
VLRGALHHDHRLRAMSANVSKVIHCHLDDGTAMTSIIKFGARNNRNAIAKVS